jgi:hypothetical protein
MVKPIARNVVGTAVSFLGAWALTGWLDDLGFGISAKAAVWIFCLLAIVWLWVTDEARLAVRQKLYDWRRRRPKLSFLFAACVGAVIAPLLWFVITLRPPAPPPQEDRPITRPIVSVAYRILPFDLPYPPGTTIAGIEFKPRKLDVRLQLKVQGAPVRNCELDILLINTSGQLLAIDAVGQLTRFPQITIFPELGGRGAGDGVVVRNDDGSWSRVPVGSESPQGGKFVMHSARWRVHADSMLADTAPEFVLMVDKPYRTKMIEGFLTVLSYEFGAATEPQHHESLEATLFAENGQTRAVTQDELERLKARYLQKPQPMPTPPSAK